MRWARRFWPFFGVSALIGCVERAPLRDDRTDILDVATAQKRVEAFLGRPFPRSFSVREFPNRRALTEFWRKDWGEPSFESQCWMVASGTADTLAILSPSAWSTEACDHDAGNRAHVANLVAHELTHVFHAQHSSAPKFQNVEGIDWFVEGLAVYVSGQLAEGHLARVKNAVQSGPVIEGLADAWKGPLRYGVSGSLVQFVACTRGRATITTMLSAVRQEDLLAILKTSEEDLLREWRQFVASKAADACR